MKMSKCKAAGRNAFIKIGNMAVGNSSSDDKRGNTTPVPFSVAGIWPFEKPMPKRKAK